MLPDDSCVTKDKFGCPIIEVTQDNLRDFPALISWIRQRGYGRDTGLLKLHLSPADRRDTACVKQITTLMRKAFKVKEWHDDSKEFRFAYRPSVQIAHRVSPNHHLYQYSKVECTDKERKQFFDHSVKPLSYRKKKRKVPEPSRNGTPHVTSGDLDQLRRHNFTHLEESSPNLLHAVDSEETASPAIQPPIYGDGIVLDKEATICLSGGFSFSSGLDTLLSHLDQKYDGIDCPYFYSGEKHSLFPWHVEDGGLFSINYNFAGAPKFWFGISPDYFGLVDKIASGIQLDLSYSSCRALLVDHKVLVADPEYFRDHFQVPFTQVIQEPGEFIVTLPFGLHAGFNTGKNLAVAANFADVPWIELGIYTPVCTCNEEQVQLNLSEIIREFRPDLLGMYSSDAPMVYPRTHPREVRYPPLVQGSHATSIDGLPGKISPPSQIEERSVRPKKYFKATARFKDRILYCPECQQSFKENKVKRLKDHIEKQHPSKREELLRKVTIKYPSWKPKMTKGLTCKICKKVILGDKTNLRVHISLRHLK